MKKTLPYLVGIFLIVLFLFLRFYHIKDSLFFFNDMGRDLLALLDMIQNHKPVLLGPQSSALPINQSPLYYYLLLPFYLIFDKSFLTANLTLAFVYLSLFLFNLYQYHTNKIFLKLIFISFFLLSIHPQYILQGRFVWNPSLVTPFLITAILSFYQLLQKYNLKQLLISTISFAIAVSFSYSIVPLVIAILILGLFVNRKILSQYTAYFSAFLTIFNLSIIAYEIRYFLRLGTIFPSNQINQIGNTYLQKINDFKNYVLASGNPVIDNFLLLGLVVLIIFSLKSKNNLAKYLASLFTLTFLITVLSPFNLQAHYIFALTSIIFLLIGSLNLKFSLPIIFVLAFFYLSPQKLLTYFQKASRTYQEMNLCFQNYCRQHPEPTFVSVQSNLYPYHYGPEHRYLMKLNNCQVKNIETENGQTSFMTVVLDNSTFSNQTKYYELDLFGPSKVIYTFSCQSNFKVVILQKI